jgi:hypothetical protein
MSRMVTSTEKPQRTRGQKASESPSPLCALCVLCGSIPPKNAPNFELERGREAWLTMRPTFWLVGYSSGQRGQTVNLLAYASEGSNPSPTTIFFCFVRPRRPQLCAERQDVIAFSCDVAQLLAVRSLHTLMKKLIIISLCLLSVWSSPAELQRSDTKESLRDLNGVFVISQFIDVTPDGLTTDKVEDTTKATLRKAGITIDAEPKKAHGDANLSITISTIKDAQLGLYLFTVEAAVTQEVRLTRQTNVSAVSAETWRRSIQGLTTPDRTDVIEQALQQCLTQFVTCYQAVNPPGTQIIPQADK